MPNQPKTGEICDPERRPFGDSLCWRCSNHRLIRTARSDFVMCTALAVKYPRQPVAACPGFRLAVRD